MITALLKNILINKISISNKEDVYVLDADAVILVSVKIAQNAQLVAIIKIYKSKNLVI